MHNTTGAADASSSAAPSAPASASSSASSSLTPDQIFFTNAFNAHRHALVDYSRCKNLDELRVVRDGFLLALASDLCPTEYDPVRFAIVSDPSVAGAVASSDSFRRTVVAARTSASWGMMTDAVKFKAKAAGSDLDDILRTLEDGRMEWLGAASAAHRIKVTLRVALAKDDKSTEGDESDAKMVWIYALCASIPSLRKKAAEWGRVVEMKDPTRPLEGYKADLWDCRREEWRPLDLGAQEAAERGGSTLDEAWKA
eukprot:CAMPEP_0113543626 /NCGR_PEP_ID=MMETSP0015_2-20120614/10260_1 /TAXON_ID=2838 /ORGANISM="Odontella" /LENGTH=254 /DNA_ID=CAMNT_0000443801 /DNA_START=132 /DNA_END=899 /DNA_ORIENTATION=- /assembly_acc=CAM_ASM_000160